MHIAIVTSGGAGMFCGSCMHDNTWAKALMAAGSEISLIPTYTPIRVDEEDQSRQPVFFGGINVYLDYRYPLWRKLPRFWKRWLDAPWVLNLASRYGVSNDAQDLGALTIAMLKGETGPERSEVEELVLYLGTQLRPDVVIFSNAMLGAGTVPALKRSFDGRVYCILQGDDIFLESLVDPYQEEALDRMRKLMPHFDGLFVHSAYYRDFMSSYLHVPAEKFELLPLGIELEGHDGQAGTRDEGEFTVGYFARICPEKGLHHLVEAFRKLHRKHPQTRLRASGYLGGRDRTYFRELMKSAVDLGDAFTYVDSPSREEKVTFLKSLDVLSVPTVYHEPKGIYVLEAMANGVPVVQPRHGAFPEMLALTEGGLLVEPGDADDLARTLEELMLDRERRLHLGRTGQENVRRHFNPQTMAERTLEHLNAVVQPAM